MLKVARKKPFCRVLGPGMRSVIWFHGCSKRCVGCIAASMHESRDYESCSPEHLANWILTQQDIEGITLSGGEPFEQEFAPLKQFLELITENSQLSVLVYTGRQYEELMSDENNRILLQYVDVLIDGEYEINLDTGKRWRGSDNQRFHFLSPRYSSEQEIWNNSLEREIEIELDINGLLWISGVPPKGFIDQLTAQLSRQGVSLAF